MKKFLSGLLCAAMTVSLFTAMTGGASADGIDVDPNWQYKTMVNFDDLQQGYQFGGASDPCSLYVERGQGWQAKVNAGGYKGSNCFYLYSKSDKKGDYAQPLINAQGFTTKNTEFVGATEFWMWVDFTHIEWDTVGLQFRLIEDDYNPDGSRAGVDLSQLAVGKGQPVYIQSGSSWKAVSQSSKNYLLPVDQMKGYKGFIRIPFSSLVMHKDGTDDDGKINMLNVTQAWFIFNWPNKDPANDYLAIDQLMFVGPSLKDGSSISKIKLGNDTSSTSAAVTQAASNGGSTTAAAKSNTSTSTLKTDMTLANSSDVDSTDETDTTEAEITTVAKTTATAAEAITNTTKKSSSAVPIVIAIICVVLIGGGAAVYFFVIKKKFPNGLFKK